MIIGDTECGFLTATNFQSKIVRTVELGVVKLKKKQIWQTCSQVATDLLTPVLLSNTRYLSTSSLKSNDHD